MFHRKDSVTLAAALVGGWQASPRRHYGVRAADTDLEQLTTLPRLSALHLDTLLAQICTAAGDPTAGYRCQ